MSCPGCGKSHYKAKLALACRRAAALEMAAREPSKHRVMVVNAREASTSRMSMKDYVDQQTRDNAVGGSA